MYHTFLHHSQTKPVPYTELAELVYHTFLHHSQTRNMHTRKRNWLVYHTFLHHSQTVSPGFESFTGLCTIHFYIILKLWLPVPNPTDLLVYHTFLHHSQTGTLLDMQMISLVYHTFLHHSQTIFKRLSYAI